MPITPGGLDRSDPKSAETVATELYPEQLTRRARLARVADGLALANELGPGTWSLTLHRRRIKLNVGRILMLSLRGPATFVSLLSSALEKSTEEELRRCAHRVFAFRAVEGVTAYVLPDADLDRLWPAIDKAFREGISAAARSSRQTPYSRSHSSGLLEYVRSSTGRSLPEPRYDGGTGQPRMEEFQQLWDEFLEEYFETEKGRKHLEMYARHRAEGKHNYETILTKSMNGEDVTDLVLLKLLPHMNSKGNREREAWIFVAPAVTKDLKQWFEGAGWTKPADWPRVAGGILEFIRRSLVDEESFKRACMDFASLEYSKGFQTGILTPILSAVAPERFLLMNNKSRRTLNRFAGTNFRARLTDYPALNEAGHRFLSDLEPLLESIESESLIRSDVFDMFCDWYVVAKQGFNRKPPLTPGEHVDEDELAVESATATDADRGEEPPYFSEEAFVLLQGLMETPTKQYHDQHRDELKAQVVEPFKRLLVKIADRLPVRMKKQLETEDRLFSRLLKNDYGKGGAWPFYWGAFYPKGGKKTKGPQLYAWINGERVECGFTFGNYDEESFDLLTRGLFSLQRDARSEVEKRVLQARFHVGPRSSPRRADSLGHFDDYLRFVKEADEGFTVRRIMLRQEVIGMPARALESAVLEAFTTLFPIFELANGNEPSELGRDFDVAVPVGDAGISELQVSVAEASSEAEPLVKPAYTIDDLIAETGFERDDVQGWLRILRRKKQIVLQGPPGTGKTYLALRMASHLVAGSRGILQTVQFHPAYAYEDFMQGLRPTPATVGISFRLEEGRFLRFCREARRVFPDPAVLIIDEINRANLAHVFGELMLLLEYRDREIPLAAGGVPFRIPENVFIIGTMNTADRSIARMDHALRRRFSFIRLRPNYDVLRGHLETHGFKAESLLKTLRDVNDLIDDPNYQLGISYFLRQDGDLRSHLADIWLCEIEPYLEEYFYDQPDKVSSFRWKELVKDRLSDWV
jgi:hypothetical protein